MLAIVVIWAVLLGFFLPVAYVDTTDWGRSLRRAFVALRQHPAFPFVALVGLLAWFLVGEMVVSALPLWPGGGSVVAVLLAIAFGMMLGLTWTPA